ncbi:MAG TPA: hypothetical protein ENI34_01110 [candidate division WOR-3 bacterium]|uniref:Glycosyltransferase RgtA/B/C/D-like domain-containing protein n=1 Tax=candidate division WOR-3 bacterium TaxID=2052148 RepID=A0A9C9JZB2_UNCW3|nr:hypothetical protein [candidate division WOR-3 bacterium]
MAALFKKSAYKADFTILFFVFAVSRAVLTWSGVHFNITPLYWFFQFLDPLYLKSDLFRSLLYLHSQPPGFNLFLGIVLKLFSGHELLVFKTIYLLIGLSMTILLYLMSRKLKIPPMIALPVTIFFSISPPILLLENWLFYTYPVTFLLLVSCFFLYKYLEKNRRLYLFLFFCTIGSIVLTRTLFHTIWMMAAIAGLILFQKKEIKKIILCAALPLLIIFAVHIKNYLIFHQISLSSWFGMNLIKMTWTVPVDELRSSVENEEVSEIAGIMPFRPPEVYSNYANFDTVTGIPVLDEKYKSTGYINFNHIAYISISDHYLDAAKYLITRYPGCYGLSIIKALYTYLRPCSDSVIISGHNRKAIKGWVDFYEKYLIGDILSKVWSADFINRAGQARKVHLNYLYLFIPFIYLWSILLAVRGDRALTPPGKYKPLPVFICYNIIYVTTVGNLIEMSENMRFRFLLLPFIYIILMNILKYCFKKTEPEVPWK